MRVAARPVRGPPAADRVPLHVPPRLGGRAAPSCTAGTDEVAPGFIEHLNIRDTTYALVSRAPLAKLERWKAEQGWTIPWYSTNDGDFSYDFGATIDASRGYDEFNYRTLDEYAAMGEESMKTAEQPYDMPGRTCFLAGGRHGVPHLLGVRPRAGEHRRLVLLPRPHRARTPKRTGKRPWQAVPPAPAAAAARLRGPRPDVADHPRPVGRALDAAVRSRAGLSGPLTRRFLAMASTVLVANTGRPTGSAASRRLRGRRRSPACCTAMG